MKERNQSGRRKHIKMNNERERKMERWMKEKDKSMEGKKRDIPRQSSRAVNTHTQAHTSLSH